MGSMEKTIEKIIERLKDFEPTKNERRQIIKWLGVENDDGKRVKRVFWHFCGGEDYDGFPYVCFNPDDSSCDECFDKAELCIARAEL